MIKRATKRSWDVLDVVTSWQEHSKDVNKLENCVFPAFRSVLPALSSFKNAVWSLWSLSERDADFKFINFKDK